MRLSSTCITCFLIFNVCFRRRLRAELEASSNELLKIRMQNEELKRRIDNFDGELAQMKSIIEQSKPSLVFNEIIPFQRTLKSPKAKV